jgi:hypothetical protein
MKIAMAVDGFFSKQQKALFLQQRIAAINADLQRPELANVDLHDTGNIAATEDDDDIQLLIRRVDVLPAQAGSEVRHVALAEARCLRWLPCPEYGIWRWEEVRVYFRFLSLPIHV